MPAERRGAGPGDVRSGPAAVGGPSPAPGSARRPPLLRARLGAAPLRPRLGEERGQPPRPRCSPAPACPSPEQRRDPAASSRAPPGSAARCAPA
ncbi:transcription initiation factor TFIID subunit 4-like [Prinia subflava]|uniref:transcription initiation factor TFIID subunit 4-like n=1 Tax=Prinia subflava TaxID=208062 RepID=UPI002FE374B6